MAILPACTATVKPAARVLFDSAEFYNYAVDFGTDLQPPRMTLAEELAYWEGLATIRRAEREAEEVRFQQRRAEARAHLAELDRKYGPLQAKPSPRDFILEGLVWDPRPAGYDAQDQADFAAGRLITAAELEARMEAEEEARMLANCPAEVHEEMWCGGESSRPFEA